MSGIKNFFSTLIIALSLVSCVSLSESGKNVKYTLENIEPPTNCFLLGEVSTFPFDYATIEEVLTSLRNKTAEKGGNYLIPEIEEVGSIIKGSSAICRGKTTVARYPCHYKGSGKVYLCKTDPPQKSN